YLAHKKGLDGKCFHLTDPAPHRVGEVLNIFAKAGHAPQMTMRINAKMFGFIPAPILYGLGSLSPVKRAIKVVLTDLGIPRDVFQFVNWPTRYDNREAAKALKGSGIEVPDVESYAAKIWDYWERNLDPDLFVDRSLAGRVRDKVVVVTGGLSRAPRFSAYVASKSALDAFAECAASEIIDKGVHFTNINMPLVRTPMIAPTKMYENVPTLSPDEAAGLVVEAIVYRPVRI